MQLAILSDIHDNTQNLRRALQKALDAGCTQLLFLGDMTTPGTLRLLLELWPHEMQLVPGNNDYSWGDIHNAPGMHRACFHNVSAEIETGGRRLYMTHVPSNGVRYAAECGEYDLVLFGHTHRSELQMCGHTIVANPGDIQGRYGTPSFAVYDTEAHRLTHIAL